MAESFETIAAERHSPLVPKLLQKWTINLFPLDLA